MQDAADNLCAECCDRSQAWDLEHCVHGCDSVDRLLTQALQERQWDCVVGMSKRCSERQRSVAIQQAMSQGQWPCVGQLVRLGVPSEVREEVALRALGSSQMGVVQEMVDLGVGAQSQDTLCQQAAGLRQWDVVNWLAQKGLGVEVRREVLKTAVAHGQQRCTVTLMTQGVPRQDVEDSVKALIHSQQCAWVMELVKACSDPNMLHMALEESMEQDQWQLVSQLVTLNVTDSHKEMVCKKAAMEYEWEVVIQLLCDGVSPAEGIISMLFQNNMAPQLLSCFSQGKVHSSARESLLQSAARFGNGDFLLEILRRETVPDRQLMDTIMLAVDFKQGHVLLQLFRCHSRSRRVFKQFFPSELRSDGYAISWIFNCLDEGGVKDLALCIGTYAEASLVVEAFFRRNIADISMKKQKFRHAWNHLYTLPFCRNSVISIATELSDRSQYDRRYIFWFALGQKDFNLAAEVYGPGVRQKDFKLAVSWILNEHSVKCVTTFIKKAKMLCRECCVKLATQCALERLSDHRTGTDQYLFLELYQMNQDNTFCQRLFRTAVRQFIRNDDDELFVHFFRVYFWGADLVGNDQLKDDCQFACLKALKVRKYSCIENIIFFVVVGLEINNAFILRMVLNIVFGRSDLDAVSFLQDVCRLEREGGSDGIVDFVLDELFSLKQWKKFVPAVDEWLTDHHFDCPPHSFLPAFISIFGKEQRARVVMSWKAKWCLRKSYYNLAFVLAFSLQDWNMLEEMLTMYCPPFGLRRCVEKVVDLGQFSIAVALLRHCSIDFISPQISSEKSRNKLADKCLDSGLMTWAVVFTIPDWDRIYSLVQTGQHPDALDLALELALSEGNLGFVENLMDRCTKFDGVLKAAVVHGHWDYVEKLMDKCTDPDILHLALRKAFQSGRLEIVRFLIWRVDLNDILLRMVCILREMPLTNCSNILQALCILVKAGVSTVERSPEWYPTHCPLEQILHDVPFPVKSDAVRLVIRSGAVSYRKLDELKCDLDWNRNLATENDQSWKQCCTDIVEAATTPCSLQHLARLTASDAIGCHPGRQARIDSLPIPECLKCLLYFKDVTEQYEEDVTEQYEGE